MRAFLSFEISQEVAERLAEAQRELRDTRADVSVVAKDNLHFTVKFLGEVSDDTPQVVDQRLASVNLSAFEVRVRGVGVFPNLRRPRVVWVGVAPEDEAVITKTATTVIEALTGIGQTDERGFTPHITLGRVRSPRNLEPLVAFVRGSADREFGPTRVETLKLKSSLLTPNGAVYTDLRRYPLK